METRNEEVAGTVCGLGASQGNFHMELAASDHLGEACLDKGKGVASLDLEGSSAVVTQEEVLLFVSSPCLLVFRAPGPTSIPCRLVRSYKKQGVGKDCDGPRIASPESEHGACKMDTVSLLHDIFVVVTFVRLSSLKGLHGLELRKKTAVSQAALASFEIHRRLEMVTSEAWLVSFLSRALAAPWLHAPGRVGLALYALYSRV